MATLLAKNKSSDHALAGAAAGFITRALAQPFDVLKIRFQLQVEPIKNTAPDSKYRSLPQATYLIVKEEGVKALWKGHVPGQLLSISYGLVQFYTFEMARDYGLSLKLSRGWEPSLNFISGNLAGCVATFVSFPFDVVRTRLVAQSELKKIYPGAFHALVSIARNEGFLVLFRGILPTFIQVGPQTGVQFMTYKIFDKSYKKYLGMEDTSLGSSLVSGSLAGMCGKAAVYPLDLVKKRMQVQGFEEGRKIFGQVFTCKGLVHCIVQLYKHEGILSFYKGLNPSLIKAIVTSALHFSGYEMVLKAFRLYRTESA